MYKLTDIWWSRETFCVFWKKNECAAENRVENRSYYGFGAKSDHILGTELRGTRNRVENRSYYGFGAKSELFRRRPDRFP